MMRIWILYIFLGRGGAEGFAYGGLGSPLLRRDVTAGAAGAGPGATRAWPVAHWGVQRENDLDCM